MADNVLASVAVGTGATFATKDILGIQYPRNILVTAAGVDISPLAEGGNVAVSNFPASQAVTGTFWQATQPVSIAGTVAVSGPLTDAQLRLSAVPVTMASTTVTGSVAVTGTFWQATQPISGTVTVNTISGFATETTAAAINTTLTAGTVQLRQAALSV